MLVVDIGDIVENKKTGQLHEVIGVINDKQIFYFVNDLTGKEDNAPFTSISKHWKLTTNN